MVDINNDDLAELVSFLQGLNLDYSLGREFGYVDDPNGPVLICVDAVLQARRNYERIVKPRINRFRRQWPQISSLSDLKRLIERYGHGRFEEEVWDYRSPKRVQTLELLVDWFLAYKRKLGFADDLDAMRHWARQPYRQPLSADGVRGIGFKTTKYLQMLAGTQTVAPDTHIHQAVEDALGRSVANETAVDLLEEAARRLGVGATALDHAIWKVYSGNQAGQQKERHGRAVCS